LHVFAHYCSPLLVATKIATRVVKKTVMVCRTGV
jgi:hypothetical protein